MLVCITLLGIEICTHFFIYCINYIFYGQCVFLHITINPRLLWQDQAFFL